MAVAADYDLTVREADKALRAARTADDVRNVWKTHMGVLGHRTLGRLLLGRTAAELIAKRDEREDANPPPPEPSPTPPAGAQRTGYRGSAPHADVTTSPAGAQRVAPPDTAPHADPAQHPGD
jgi:hypothetical protein